MTQYIKFRGALYRKAEEEEPYFTVVKDGAQQGLRCVVLLTTPSPGKRNINGYVGVSKAHPLYGKHYQDEVPNLLATPGGTVGDATAIENMFIKNGGVEVTYSEAGDDLYPVPAPELWWFGTFFPTYKEKGSAQEFRDMWLTCGELAKRLVAYANAAKKA